MKVIRILALTTLGVTTVLALAACPLPGENPKPVPSWTPEPAWSWPYGETTPAEESIKEPPPAADPVRYKSCVDLRKDHPHGTKKVSEGYRLGLDRDHDGTACEPEAILAEFTWTPTTTPARQRRIEVVDKLAPTKWHVSAAAEWLDRATASNMVTVSRCSGRAWKCITVRGGKLPGSVLGLTQGNTVTIDYRKVDRRGYRSDAWRKKILAHELAHTLGLGHTRSGANLMRTTLPRVTLHLTPSQRRYLAAR